AEVGTEGVRNPPIIESGAIGAALGLALDGFRPVVEMQFGDFVTCGFNQLVNNVATTRYRWDAPVPLVVRLPVGGGLGAGPFPPQNGEAWFCHVAGLKVVAAATPADAKGLLLAALDDGNPVLVLEHKKLYPSAKGPVPAGHPGEPLGHARIARPGTDATLVTYGAGVAWALAAADTVAAEDGHEVEVIDLRSLRPWDRPMVLDSVRRTSRALVAHEAPLTGGFGAEIAAVIGQEAFPSLDPPGSPPRSAAWAARTPPPPSPPPSSAPGPPRTASSPPCAPCSLSEPLAGQDGLAEDGEAVVELVGGDGERGHEAEDVLVGAPGGDGEPGAGGAGAEEVVH